MKNTESATRKKEKVPEVEVIKDKGVYVGVEDDDDDDEDEVEDDGLGDIWKDMSMALEFSKRQKTTRTYASESGNGKDRDSADVGIRLDQDLIATDVCAHPRHAKQMKPHQVEGFNFLRKNLLADNPGGCILAHAPGSGMRKNLQAGAHAVFFELVEHTLQKDGDFRRKVTVIQKRWIDLVVNPRNECSNWLNTLCKNT